jgi:arginine decarboxylase
LSPDELTFCVLARSETNEPGRRIAAGIGLARPKDPTHYGYISEHHAFGMSDAQMRDYVEESGSLLLVDDAWVKVG